MCFFFFPRQYKFKRYGVCVCGDFYCGLLIGKRSKATDINFSVCFSVSVSSQSLSLSLGLSVFVSGPVSVFLSVSIHTVHSLYTLESVR